MILASRPAIHPPAPDAVAGLVERALHAVCALAHGAHAGFRSNLLGYIRSEAGAALIRLSNALQGREAGDVEGMAALVRRGATAEELGGIAAKLEALVARMRGEAEPEETERTTEPCDPPTEGA